MRRVVAVHYPASPDGDGAGVTTDASLVHSTPAHNGLERMFPTVRFAARLDLILYLDGSSRLSCDI
jgi:hypothetical protein